MLENKENNAKSVSLLCEIVEDLLPLYVEGLTNPTTTASVKNHLNTCADCNKKYIAMKNPVPEEETENPEAKEIDFLRKTKKRNRKIICIVAAILFIAAFLFVEAKYFVIGNDMNAEYLNYSLEVSADTLHISGQTTSDMGIQDVKIAESDGVVKVSIRGVEKSLFYGRSFEKDFQASGDIRQVWVGDQIIWADGEKISPITVALNANYNPYVGNMSQNGKLVLALNMTGYMGSFKNELQTKEEPYGWTLILADDFPEKKKEELEERLSAYAYLLLAEIENLGEITYEYTMAGNMQSLTITEADASGYAGEDIKEVGRNITALERLVQKTGLNQYTIGVGNM